MDKISRHIGYVVLAAAVLALGGCVTTKVANKAAEIEGHYAYEHSWSYDDDGTALDSAVQVYEFTLLNSGCKASRPYLYFSPSRWRVDGDDFYFSGIKESSFITWDAEVLWNIDYYTDSCLSGEELKTMRNLAERIFKNVITNIDKETKFHYSKPSKNVLVWTYTYSDGHSDTWKFRRLHAARKKSHFPLGVRGYGCGFVNNFREFKDINTFDPMSNQKSEW